ncbi:MAG: type IV secretion system protein, partial [Candidatus Dormibacteria bacterium]
MIRSISDVVGSVGELVRDPFLWLAHRLFPTDFLDLLRGQLQAASSENTYSKLYRGTVPAGIAIAGICATARLTRSMYDDRMTGLAVVLDNLVRFAAGALMLGAPTPAAATGDGMPVGWQLVRLGSNASITVAGNIVGLLGSSSVFNADVSTSALVGRFATLLGLSSIPVFGFFFAIILILVGVGILYMAMIMVMRSIMLAFAIAAAPLCIATAVFDHRNRFFQWWLELFGGAVLIPVVLAFTLSITTGFALHFDNPAASFLPITGVLLGGMWFTGKAVHQLTWRHFSHGGITGALTALSTTAMAAPGIAAQAGSLLAAAGHPPRPGGMLDSLAGIYRGRGGPAPGAGESDPAMASLPGRAHELASAASAESTLAAAGAGAG